MTTYYRALTSDYLTNPRMSPEMALVMNYLLAQADGFEINRVHLYRVFQGRIGQDRIKRALTGLAAEGYIVAQKPWREAGRIKQKPSKVSHALCVYAGRTEGVSTTPPVSTPTSTTMKELDTLELDGTEGVNTTPPVKPSASGNLSPKAVSAPGDLGSSPKAPLSASAGQTTSALGCGRCGSSFENPGTLSSHVYSDHRDDYDDFMAWFGAYKDGSTKATVYVRGAAR